MELRSTRLKPIFLHSRIEFFLSRKYTFISRCESVGEKITIETTFSSFVTRSELSSLPPPLFPRLRIEKHYILETLVTRGTVNNNETLR